MLIVQMILRSVQTTNSISNSVIERGAFLSFLSTQDGVTPLHIAAENGHTELLQCLLKAASLFFASQIRLLLPETKSSV